MKSRYWRFRLDYDEDDEKHMSQFGPLLNADSSQTTIGEIFVGVQDFGKEISPGLVMRILRYKYGMRNFKLTPLFTEEEYLKVCAAFDRVAERHRKSE